MHHPRVLGDHHHILTQPYTANCLFAPARIHLSQRRHPPQPHALPTRSSAEGEQGETRRRGAAAPRVSHT
jgi:hypothetical protein